MSQPKLQWGMVEAKSISISLLLLTQLENVLGFSASFQSLDNIVHRALAVSAAYNSKLISPLKSKPIQ
jgi:hypothetical protein